jgi:phenylalanyl-tRNA synthetase beta chain
LALFVTGKQHQSNWLSEDVKGDFYYLKSFVINLLKLCGIKNLQTQQLTSASWDYGITLSLGKKEIVTLGLISNKIAAACAIKQSVFYACLNLDELIVLTKKNKVKFSAIPVFPSVQRDLAIIIDRAIPYEKMESLAKKQAGQLLQEVSIFDVYEDKKIGEDKKSCALSFIFMDKTKTLTDIDIEQLMTKLINGFKSELNAEIRN